MRVLTAAGKREPIFRFSRDSKVNTAHRDDCKYRSATERGRIDLLCNLIANYRFAVKGFCLRRDGTVLNKRAKFLAYYCAAYYTRHDGIVAGRNLSSLVVYTRVRPSS